MKIPSARYLVSAAISAILIVATLPLMDSSSAYAKRKRKKKKNRAGVVADSRYTDNTYGFSVKILDGWKPSVKKKNSNLRLVVSKKDYNIPIDFQNATFHTTIPKLKVYVDTTSMDVRAFIDSLKSKTFKSDQKKDISLEFAVLEGKFTRPRVTRIKSNSGVAGRRMKTTRIYKLEVQKAERLDAEVVTDYLQGDLAFFKNDDHIYVLSCICEAEFYAVNEPLFDEMIASFTLPE